MRTTVKLLYGEQVDEDELLKIASTALEDVLLDEKEEEANITTATSTAAATSTSIRSNSSSSSKLPSPYQSPLVMKERHPLQSPPSSVEDNDEDTIPKKRRRQSADSFQSSIKTKSGCSSPRDMGEGGVSVDTGIAYDSNNDNYAVKSMDFSPSSQDSNKQKKRGITSSRDASKDTAVSSYKSSKSKTKTTSSKSMANKSQTEGIDNTSELLPVDMVEEEEEEEEEEEDEVEETQQFYDIASTTSTTIATATAMMAPAAPQLLPYPPSNQLEYLDEGFQILALLVRANAARMKDDMKKEGTRINNWDGGEVKHGRRELQAKLAVQEHRMSRRITATQSAGLSLPRVEILANRFELDAFEKKIILLLIGKTVSPIVKTLMETLDSAVSRAVDDAVTVGQALTILCQDFATQIAYRKYFYMSGKLVTNGIISLSRSRWHQGSGDLTDHRIILDRRVLDWAVGLDTEINELVEGSDLYEPKVNLSQVVLPPGQIDTLLSQCRAYDSFLKYRKSSGLENRLSYGNGLVIMLCGKSGTGKTMTVNAIAHELQKKVLLVDFGSLSGRKEGAGELDADLKGLFRESQMNNAVLFFDECEIIFKSRNSGSDRLLNSLLTEIERHVGIVFLATNRPYDLDEAMHRRITLVLEYRSPDHNMRKSIWEILLGIRSVEESPKKSVENRATTANNNNNNSIMSTHTIDIDSHNNNSNNYHRTITGTTSTVATTNTTFPSPATTTTGTLPSPPPPPTTNYHLNLSDDIDVYALAVKYELTGGFIKNAVLSALLTAIARDANNPVISQADLLLGCKLQMRGSLSARAVENKVLPGSPLNTLALAVPIKETADTIIRIELARSTVYGSWSHIATAIATTSSTSTSSPTTHAQHAIVQRATICAFAGPCGSGKRTLAKSLAYELQRGIKMIHVAELLTGNLIETMSIIESTMQDAKLSDAVIIIDGFEHLLDDTLGPGEGGWKLQLLLSKLLSLLITFPGCVLLICHIDSPLNVTLQKDFATKLFCFLRFQIPPYDIRAKLWSKLMPSNTPLDTDVIYMELGRRFELSSGGISAAIIRACSEAARRDMMTDRIVRQKDLRAAGEAEVAKLQGNMTLEISSKMFT